MKLPSLIRVLLLTLLLSACGNTDNSDDVQNKADATTQAAEYTCPMHPHYISTDPDGSCPICGMDLVPVKSAESEPVDSEITSAITVSPTMLQTMNVRTSSAEIVEFGRNLRAFGTVEADERLENVSVSRVEGWIENLKVRAEGDAVAAGDLLYLVYSPDLIAAQRDYISALSAGSTKRLEAVKQRLLSIGMQEKALAQLAQRKTVINKVPIYAESDGIVAQLNIRDGDYIKPGSPIMRLQSYRKVWVIASIPETDLPLIDRGILADLRFPSAPNAPSTGRVGYIYPTIDPKTRTGRVRIEVDNVSSSLLPGAYADVTLAFAKQKRLSIDSEAILRDNRGDHVILALGEGRFGTRPVTVGINADGRTEILAGLQAGELIVASGQFMLDSEVNLREGLSKLAVPVMPVESKMDSAMKMDSNESNQLLSELELDASAVAQIDHLIDMALYFHLSLINDEAIDPSFVDPAISLVNVLHERYAGSELAQILRKSKDALTSAQVNQQGNALATDLSALINALDPWLLQGAPQHYSDLGLTLYRDTNSGQRWLQSAGTAANPYGDDEWRIQPWPKSNRGLNSTPTETHNEESNEPSEQMADPHAGHR